MKTVSKKLSLILCLCGGLLLLAGIISLVILMTQASIIGGAGLPTLLYLLHGVPTALLALGALLLLIGICRLVFIGQK